MLFTDDKRGGAIEDGAMSGPSIGPHRTRSGPLRPPPVGKT
ncbi:hypothetical protein ACF1BK_03495 [Streptomyces globisporus]